jgi:hypothetical protein
MPGPGRTLKPVVGWRVNSGGGAGPSFFERSGTFRAMTLIRRKRRAILIAKPGLAPRDRSHRTFLAARPE